MPWSRNLVHEVEVDAQVHTLRPKQDKKTDKLSSPSVVFATCSLPVCTKLHHQPLIWVLPVNLLRAFGHNYTQAFPYRLVHALSLPENLIRIQKTPRTVVEPLE